MSQPQIVYVRASNGTATAALVCGIVGLFLMPIPLFIGFILGVPLALLAIILGIVGHNVARRVGVGFGAAGWGTGLGVLTLVGVAFGGGIIW